jgi:hypothetical protein
MWTGGVFPGGFQSGKLPGTVGSAVLSLRADSYSVLLKSQKLLNWNKVQGYLEHYIGRGVI